MRPEEMASWLERPFVCRRPKTRTGLLLELVLGRTLGSGSALRATRAPVCLWWESLPIPEGTVQRPRQLAEVRKEVGHKTT